MAAVTSPNSPTNCSVPNRDDTPWAFVGSVSVSDTPAPVPDTPASLSVPNSELAALRITCESLEKALEVRDSRIKILKQHVEDLIELKKSYARTREAEIKLAVRERANEAAAAKAESEELRGTIEQLVEEMKELKATAPVRAPKPEKIGLPKADEFDFAKVTCFERLKIKNREDLKNKLAEFYIAKNKVYHESWKRDAVNQSKYKSDWVCDCLSLTDKTEHYEPGDLYTMLTFLLNVVHVNGAPNVGKGCEYQTIQHRIAHWFFPTVVTTEYKTFHPKTPENAYAHRQAYACTTGLNAMWEVYQHSPLGTKEWPTGWVEGDHIPKESKVAEREEERERAKRETDAGNERGGKGKRAKR